ncbi:MAG TPA: DUF559 domain-containing protein [Alphaproteobacteria bacterium]
MTSRTVRPRARIARSVSRNATEAERALWRVLHELGPNWRFRRQHPIGPYVVDFACPARKLAIELDGGHHADQVEADARRSAELALYGYRAVRFWNDDVFRRFDAVKATIWWELEGNPTSPHPLLPVGEERE